MYGGEHETTNNRMELTAVIEALNALNGSRKVLLHTDSKYVLAEELEATRLENRRQETGQEPGPVGGARRGSESP
jgi:ribonuclease HI